MRLLHKGESGSFVLTEPMVSEAERPTYAILSHTWLSDGDEVHYTDLKSTRELEKKEGFRKLRFCGTQAIHDGYRFFWVDTCCINRESATEVQEAVTSMFRWYQKAAKCYVYLEDVTVSATPSATSCNTDVMNPEPWRVQFRNSRWFRRGWTLQELLAPEMVEFYSREGTRLGDKDSLQIEIHNITCIPLEALRREPLSNFDVHEILSWAAERETTRPEDRAYSLLGIFNVHMALLYGEGDHSFERLRRKIDRKNTERFNLVSANLVDSLPSITSATFNSAENQYKSTCLANTRVELLENISDWVEQTHDRSVYWLNGIAGTGKSTIARTVARKYHEHGLLAGSFFFTRGGGDAGSADRLFTTLSSQMAARLPCTKRYIHDAMEKHKDILKQGLRDQWQELIITPLSKLECGAGPRIILFILDALDECDNVRDIRNILGLLAMTKKLHNVRLRILITSRPENAVRIGFQQIPKAQRDGIDLHEVAGTLIEQDLTRYFNVSLGYIRQERGFPSSWPGGSVVTHLVKVSDGLFIWASTAIRYISEGRHHVRERLAKLINGRPTVSGPGKQLDQIYTLVLKECVPADQDEEDSESESEEFSQRLRTILGTIVVLFSPLSMSSLANFLSVEKEIVTESLADLHAILHISLDDDRPIRLHHPTLRDFLLDKARCRDLKFWIDERKTHKALADNCLLLMSKMLKKNICGLDTLGTRAKDINEAVLKRHLPPELRYASLYWVEHYCRSDAHPRDDDDAHVFFKEHVLHWIEVLSLMGKSSEMVAITRMYQSLLIPSENARQIPFVKASRRLMFNFQFVIEEAPLQVYSSALIFVQPLSEARHHFWVETETLLDHAVVAEADQADASELKNEYNYLCDLSFTPDGQEIASGSSKPWVRVWKVGTKMPLARFHGHVDKVSTVAISQQHSGDGMKLASGSDDWTIMIWNMETKVLRHILKGHKRWVNTLQFSPDGTLLASGSMDDTIRIWDVASGAQLHVFEPGTSGVNSVTFSPDGRTLASANVDRTIPVWDLKRGEIIKQLNGHTGNVNYVHYSPDGRRLVSGSDDNTVRLWDLHTSAVYKVLCGHTRRVRAVSFSRDGRMVASGSEDKTIRLWNADTGALLSTLRGHKTGVLSIAFFPNDGRLLASGSVDDEIMLWNVVTGEPHGKLEDFPAEIDPGTVWDRSRYKAPVSPQKGHSSAVTCIAISPNGKSVASGSRDHLVKLWTLHGAVQWTLKGHTGEVTQVLYSPTGRLLASTSIDNTIKLWDSGRGVLLYSFSGHSDAIRQVLFSRDEHIIASCSTDRTVRLWDAMTGAEIATLLGHTDTVNDIAMSTDGRTLASCSGDCTVCLWDLSSLAETCTELDGHSGSVTSISFSPDGRRLVSTSSDETIRVWQIESKTSIVLAGHNDQVTAASFSQDGKYVISSSIDGTVRLWNSEDGSFLGRTEVDISFRRIQFSGHGEFAETERGIVSLGNAQATGQSSGLRTAPRIFVGKEWVERDGARSIRLFDTSNATSVAARDRTAILGHASGAMSFLNF